MRAGARVGDWPRSRSRAPEGGLPRRGVRGRRTAALGPGVLAAGPASTDRTPRSRRARVFTSSQRRRDDLFTWRGGEQGAVRGMLPPLYAHRLGRAYGPDSSAAALRGALAA